MNELHTDRATLSVLDAYRKTLAQARDWRERAEELEKEGKRGTDVDLYHALAQELYAVCALLERTPEVNPPAKGASN